MIKAAKNVSVLPQINVQNAQVIYYCNLELAVNLDSFSTQHLKHAKFVPSGVPPVIVRLFALLVTIKASSMDQITLV